MSKRKIEKRTKNFGHSADILHIESLIVWKNLGASLLYPINLKITDFAGIQHPLGSVLPLSLLLKFNVLRLILGTA